MGNGLAGPDPSDAGCDPRLLVRNRDSHHRNPGSQRVEDGIQTSMSHRDGRLAEQLQLRGIGDNDRAAREFTELLWSHPVPRRDNQLGTQPIARLRNDPERPRNTVLQCPQRGINQWPPVKALPGKRNRLISNR